MMTRDQRSQRIGQMLIAEHLADVAALAEPYPSTVCHAHFIQRGLGAAVEAGRCTVTMPHHAFSSMPRVPVVDVLRTEDGHGFILVTRDGSQFKRYCRGELAVTWHEPDAWADLTTPMKQALRWLAKDAPAGQKKPRANTLRALEKRKLVRKGKLVRSALALYKNHRQEFADA
jgi:hypothetical protein